MPSLHDVAHDTISSQLCRSCQGNRYSTQKAACGKARPSRTISYPPGHSPPASQAGRRVGPALYSFRPHMVSAALGWSFLALSHLDFFFLAVTVNIGCHVGPSLEICCTDSHDCECQFLFAVLSIRIRWIRNKLASWIQICNSELQTRILINQIF